MDYSKFDANLASKMNVQIMMQNLGRLEDNFGLEVVLYSTSIADFDFLESFSNMYANYKSRSIQTFNVNSIIEFGSVLKRAKYAIVNRMHAGIINTAYGIRTVFYPWQSKVEGFLNEMFADSSSHFLYHDINLNSIEIGKLLNKLNNFNIEDILELKCKMLLEMDF